MKKYIALFLMVFLGYTNGFAQDGETAVNKNFRIYLDASSGTLNKNTQGQQLLGGNELEIGMEYSQNFENARWLNVGFKALIIPTLTVISTESNVIGLGSGGVIPGVGMNNLEAGMFINIFSMFRVEIDTKLRFKPSLYYTFNLPGADHKLTTIAEATIAMIPYQDGTLTSIAQDRYLGEFLVRLNYNVGIGAGWRFDTDLRFYIDGAGGPNGIGGFVESDSLEAVVNSFRIRWSNGFSYSHAGGFGFYANFRYQAERISHNTKESFDRLSLHAGMSYAFDLN